MSQLGDELLNWVINARGCLLLNSGHLAWLSSLKSGKNPARKT